MSTKKSYTSEFKARVALDSIKGDLTINEVCTKYGVHASQVNRWKHQALSFIKSGFIGKQEKVIQNDKSMIEELYRQIGKMKCENEFLKKSVWK